MCAVLLLQSRMSPASVVTLQVTWPKTLLVVSHAREFLNAVTTDTIHLHSRKLTMYKGTVSALRLV